MRMSWLRGHLGDFSAAQFWFALEISHSLYGAGKEMCSCSSHPVCWKNEELLPENTFPLCSIAIVLIKALTEQYTFGRCLYQYVLL